MKKLIFALIIVSIATGSLFVLNNKENAQMISQYQKSELSSILEQEFIASYQELNSSNLQAREKILSSKFLIRQAYLNLVEPGKDSSVKESSKEFLAEVLKQDPQNYLANEVVNKLIKHKVVSWKVQ
jgi:hypothetical protein